MHRWLREPDILFEWLRFMAVGIKSNILYYLIYVLLSFIGTGPKTAITIVFVFGATYSFWFNKSFVFKNRASARRQITRYFLVYLGAWLLNIVILDVMLNSFDLNRYIAQGALVFPFAALIFVSVKYFVFKDNTEFPREPAGSLQSNADMPIEVETR